MSPLYEEPVTEKPILNFYKFNEPVDQVIASADNHFILVIENPRETHLIEEFSLEPADKVDFTKVDYDLKTGFVDFDAGALQQGITYNLTIVVTDRHVSQFGKEYTASSSWTKNFTTEAAP